MVDRQEFTDRFLRSIKPEKAGKRSIIYDAQIPGFGIRLNGRGSAKKKGAFVLIARFPGSKNPVPRRIGDYPAMPLAIARKIARQWREDIRNGVDPKDKEEIGRREQDHRPIFTFAEALEIFAEDHLADLRSGNAVKAALRSHVLPQWRERPVHEIRRADIVALIRTLREELPIEANRVLSYLKTMFGWMVDQAMIEASPAQSIRRPAPEVTRDRVLSEFEIRAIWLACRELGAFGRAVKVMLATGQRRSEVGSMAWSEIDRKLAVWRLPKGRTKAARAHVVPLSRLALKAIAEGPAHGDYVFSASRRSPADADAGAGPIRGWSKAKAHLDKIVLEKARELSRAAGASAPKEIAAWRLHDLRRTAATYLARLGVDRIVIGKLLNHTERGVTAVYDRHSYDREKRRALDLWAARLQVIVSAEDGEKPSRGRPRSKVETPTLSCDH
jgi:integrase